MKLVQIHTCYVKTHVMQLNGGIFKSLVTKKWPFPFKGAFPFKKIGPAQVTGRGGTWKGYKRENWRGDMRPWEKEKNRKKFDSWNQVQKDMWRPERNAKSLFKSALHIWRGSVIRRTCEETPVCVGAPDTQHGQDGELPDRWSPFLKGWSEHPLNWTGLLPLPGLDVGYSLPEW